MSDAERVAEDLDIEYDIVEIDPFVEQIAALYPTRPTTSSRSGTHARARGRC